MLAEDDVGTKVACIRTYPAAGGSDGARRCRAREIRRVDPGELGRFLLQCFERGNLGAFTAAPASLSGRRRRPRLYVCLRFGLRFHLLRLRLLLLRLMMFSTATREVALTFPLPPPRHGARTSSRLFFACSNIAVAAGAAARVRVVLVAAALLSGANATVGVVCTAVFLCWLLRFGLRRARHRTWHRRLPRGAMTGSATVRSVGLALTPSNDRGGVRLVLV
jgi:hypothetical protein